jgi:hypothetical protein
MAFADDTFRKVGAYHEAGHAAVAAYLRVPFRDVALTEAGGRLLQVKPAVRMLFGTTGANTQPKKKIDVVLIAAASAR